MSKFKNKYRIESARLKDWDYSKPGAYFVTIVAFERENLFGNIENNKMILNGAGKNAHGCWIDIPIHFPHVVLDEFIIMPNLIHGIIFIIDRNFIKPVETQNFASLRNEKHKTTPGNQFGPQSKNLGSIIRGFKIGVTGWYRENGIYKTIWQSRFHDHIIRNEIELQRIRQYIISNPPNWNNDDYNKWE